MSKDDVIVQRPDTPPQQLLLLFHGVGSTPQTMAPLGHRLAAQFPQAAVVCVAGPDLSEMGSGGRQWFSVAGITEDNRAARIAVAMPKFVDAVRGWQRETGATPAQTALVGFSQGAIMSLESTQADATRSEPLAGRVVSIAGRFKSPPEHAPAHTTLHFIHGKSDPVIPYAQTVTAAERLIRLGADVTADVIPFLGHAISAEVETLLLERLTGYVPKRTWDEAARSAP